MIDHLVASGAHVYIPRNNLDYAVSVGLRMLQLRHLLANNDGWYRLVPENEDVLDFYASSIEHFNLDPNSSNELGSSTVESTFNTTGNKLEYPRTSTSHQSPPVEPSSS